MEKKHKDTEVLHLPHTVIIVVRSFICQKAFARTRVLLQIKSAGSPEDQQKEKRQEKFSISLRSVLFKILQ